MQAALKDKMRKATTPVSIQVGELGDVAQAEETPH